MNYYFSRLLGDKRTYLLFAILLFMTLSDVVFLELGFGGQYHYLQSTFLSGSILQLTLYLFFPFALLFSYAGWNLTDSKTGNFVLTLTRKGKTKRILEEVFVVGISSFILSAIPLLLNFGLVYLLKKNLDLRVELHRGAMRPEDFAQYLASLTGRAKQLYDYSNWEVDHALLINFVHIFLFCLIFSCMAVLVVLCCILFQKVVRVLAVLGVYWVGLLLSEYSQGDAFQPFSQEKLFHEKLIPVVIIMGTMLTLLGITLWVVKKRDEL